MITSTPADRVLVGLLAVGAAARLTRLVASDTITESLRERLMYDKHQRAALNRGDEVPAPVDPDVAARRDTAHQFVTCPWCVGMWIAAGVTTAATVAGHTRTFRVTTGALACSYAVGALASTVED